MSRWLTNDAVGTTKADPTLSSKIKQCYNNITVNTNNITLENTDSGVSKTVAVSGGGSSSTIAYNSVSVSGNDLVFGKTDGNTDSEPLNNLTAITDLEALTINHTNDITALETLTNGLVVSDISAIKNLTGSSTLKTAVDGHTDDVDNLKSREQFKSITQHPDLTDAQMFNDFHPLVNGRTYHFSNSSSQASVAQSVLGAFRQTDTWESEDNHAGRAYNTLVSGSFYDYSGLNIIGGHMGEFITVQLPEAVVLSSFTMSADSTQSLPRSFKVLGSIDGTTYDLLGEYTDVTVSTTDAGTNFKLDSSLSAYGSAYDYYAIVVTRVERNGTKHNVAIRHLKYFSVSKDVSDTIKKADESFNNATITGTNTLNLISDSGTTSLTLPTGTTTTSVDALTFNFTVQTVGSNDKYFLHGVEAGLLPIELLANHKYIFTFPAAHPLKLSRTADGGTRDTSTGVSLGNEEITTGVTYAPTQLTFINGSIQTFDNLYYYCENRANMGGAIIEENGFNNITQITYDSSVPRLEVGRAFHEIYGATTPQSHDLIPLSDSYTSAAISGSDLTLNRISGTNATTITLPSGSGSGGGSTTNYPEVALTSNYPPIITPAAIGAGGLDGSGGAQGTATASNSLSTSVGPLDAFNNSVTNEDRWQMSTSYGVNEWLKFDVGSGNTKFIGYYHIWARGGPNEADALSRAESLPTDWRIEGSNDDVNWITLDTRSGVNNADIAHQSSASGTLTNYPHKEYQIQNPGAYRYYRLWVVSTASSGGVIISELAYYEIDSQIPRAVGSTEYNLFTDKLFGSDNLGNLGGIDGNHIGTAGPVEYWAFDPSDNTVIVAFIDGTNLKMIKITQDGNLASSVTYPERYISTPSTLPASAADLITAWNSYSGSGGHLYTFTPHALFDLAVNDSPAYHAFDEISTTEWASHSNRYDVTTGDAVQTGFSATPPSTITFATTPLWTGLEYRSYDVTTTYVQYKLHDIPANGGAILSPDIYALTFEINGSNQLILDVDPPTTGGSSPAEFDINGGSTMTSGAVTPGDIITLYNSSSAVVATMTVPEELAIVLESKLAATTDSGEYLKLDLGLAITATTLNLKSIAEYKEPIINMTAISQCGYVVSESSYNPNYPHAHMLFNSLTTPSTDSWSSAIGTYNVSNGNHSASANLGTDFPSGGTTVDGEYVAITLPDKRKLVGYKLTAKDGMTSYNNSPKEFKLYARENSTGAWVLLNSETLTTGMGEYVSGDVNTGGTRFPSTGDLTPTTAYQTYALVVEKIFTSGGSYNVQLAEFQLFCQTSEIENFKLYGSVNNSTWTEIHDQSTSANITSSGVDFTITNPGSYQYYGLVVTKNTGYHNVSLGEMKLKSTDTVDLTNYYNKTEVDPLICKARASYVHTGGSSGTATLSNDVNIAASPSIGTIIANIPSPWNISGAHYSIYPVTFSFATARTNTNYQVLVSESTTLGNLNVVMNTCVRNKTTTDFIVNVMVYETSSSGNLKWGIDFVVF